MVIVKANQKSKSQTKSNNNNAGAASAQQATSTPLSSLNTSSVFFFLSFLLSLSPSPSSIPAYYYYYYFATCLASSLVLSCLLIHVIFLRCVCRSHFCLLFTRSFLHFLSFSLTQIHHLLFHVVPLVIFFHLSLPFLESQFHILLLNHLTSTFSEFSLALLVFIPFPPILLPVLHFFKEAEIYLLPHLTSVFFPVKCNIIRIIFDQLFTQIGTL